MTASQNVVLELKKLGIELDMPPNKLKSGYGEGVCAVLFQLCQLSIENRFKFKRPQIHDDGGGFGNDDADEMDDEFQGNADVADMVKENDMGGDDSDAIDEDMEFGNPGQAMKANEDEMLQQ